jgi:hypothetical protein
MGSVVPWQPLRNVRQTLPLVPPVADGPGVSLISDGGDGEPRRRETWLNQPREANTIRNPLFLSPRHNSHIPGELYDEDNTIGGGARFQVAVIVATTLHAADPNSGSKP